MKILLSRAHYPVTVLGYGTRAGIWFQGCSIACPGCVSRDTWDFDRKRAVDVGMVVSWCQSLRVLDGVTISGGEPFQQPDALREILQRLHDWRRTIDTDVDLLCYSGYPLEVLMRRHADILDLLDALVPEPFVERSPTDLPLRGSANQPLACLSELGARRYSGLEAGDQPRVQVAADADSIWYVGIPRRGDMERLTKAMAARGVVQGAVSWIP